MAEIRRTALIFNPASGRGDPDRDLSLVREALDGSFSLRIFHTRADVPIREQVEEVVRAHLPTAREAGEDPIIIAAGGDGTVSAVGGAILGRRFRLGVVPRGTANSFARALEIPADPMEACQVIRDGTSRVVDAAEGASGPMILMAGIGFGANMVAQAERAEKSRLGPLAYLLAGARNLTEQEPFRARIEIGTRTRELELTALTVANVAPITSLLAQGCGGVVPDDGQFEITLMSGDQLGLGEFASLLSSALRKSEVQGESILCLKTARIKIETDPSLPVVVDGEERTTTPVEFVCSQGALRVIVP